MNNVFLTQFRSPDASVLMRGAVWLATLLLFAISVWYLVRLLLLLIAGPDIVVPVTAAPRVATANVRLPGQQQIAEWHLFGQSSSTDPLQFETLPETPLNLELRGIVAGQDSDKTGHAIIVDGNGNEWVYSVGDRLADDTEVIAVQQHQVVLQRGAVREALSLPMHEEMTRNATRQPGVQRAATQPASRPQIGQQVSSLRGLRNVPAGGMPPVSIAGMNVTDFSSLAKSVQVRPVSGGGFRVFPGRDATVFRQLGLQANDVITAVNGQPLTDVQAAMRIFQQTDNIAGVTISVRRGNQVIQLQPDVSSLGN